ncbi:hypothetical protein GGI15_002975 [Coemansia interrupta]|uniref:Fe/B12 periplasmic-binding domain-containing protein n=1 Tax=Coemansia interrupta TaxID=1126814 RepID=A0A9W8HGU3_9FUNG|nr:hypothetical protein GGI15_002975 [Coemansia interrupta]
MQPRVVSLLPSATEILCAIPGGKQLLVARSSEDDFPADISHLPTVIDPIIEFTSLASVDQQVTQKMKELGTLYVVDKTKLEKLCPSVILTQDLCRVCSVDLMTVERIAIEMNPRPTVLNLSPVCLEDVLDNIREVGQTVGLVRESDGYCKELEARIDRVRQYASATKEKPRVLVLDWVKPYIVAGHWMPQVVDIAAGLPLLSPLITDESGRRRGEGARRITVSDIVDAKPDIVFVAACGLDLPTLLKEFASLAECPEWKAVRDTVPRIVLCDGHHYFNRPGPRLIDTLEFIAGYIHNIPEIIPENLAHVEL